MRKVKSWTVLAPMLMSAAVGCNEGPYQGTISAFAIRGRIVDADTGIPIAGATVCSTYAKRDVNDYVRGETKTDAEGRFTIPANPERVALLKHPDAAARPSLNVIHPEYSPTSMTIHGDREVTLTVQAFSSQYPRSGVINCSSGDSAAATQASDGRQRRARVPLDQAMRLAGAHFPDRCGSTGARCRIEYDDQDGCPSEFAVVFPEAAKDRDEPRRLWVALNPSGLVNSIGVERKRSCRGN